jgi:class 3 adenylate cyclase
MLFTDLVGSTERAAALGDSAWRDLLAQHHAAVRRALARFRGEERDTAGDGFFATFDGPARAIRCAETIVEDVRALGLDVRAGIHTGGASCTTARSRAWPSRSARASPRRRVPARFWFRRRWRISSREPVSS